MKQTNKQAKKIQNYYKVTKETNKQAKKEKKEVANKARPYMSFLWEARRNSRVWVALVMNFAVCRTAFLVFIKYSNNRNLSVDKASLPSGNSVSKVSLLAQ